MIRLAIAIAFTILVSSPAWASQPFYVVASSANERLCPSTNCPATNRLDRGDEVDVIEVIQGWARVTEYYDSSAEREEFPQITDAKVARWILVTLLAGSKPKQATPPIFDARLMDSRIQGMPDLGDGGVTSKDIKRIREKAADLIEAGECRQIDLGDKDNSGGGYYVHCDDEPRNRFFK